MTTEDYIKKLLVSAWADGYPYMNPELDSSIEFHSIIKDEETDTCILKFYVWTSGAEFLVNLERIIFDHKFIKIIARHGYGCNPNDLIRELAYQESTKERIRVFINNLDSLV